MVVVSGIVSPLRVDAWIASVAVLKLSS